MEQKNRRRLPTYFISHGGGPWPWLKKEMPFFDELEASLQRIAKEIGEKPRAILMISGHWEEDDFTVMTTEKPPMIYDYGGFPEHTYHVKYSAPGSPEVARRVCELLSGAGITCKTDDQRGYDHGTFTPLVVMYPNADVPVLQLSLKHGYDVEEHMRVGRALAPLRDEGVLIVGSGLSYHNLRHFFGENPQARTASRDFDSWLQKALLSPAPQDRKKTLMNWSQAPAARFAHPQEDHLIPLMVAVGAAENESAELVYHEDDFMGSVTASSFRFGSVHS